MPAPLLILAWAGATTAAGIIVNAIAPLLDSSADPYEFPEEAVLHPEDAPDITERLINPLWAPTAYLQGIDCLDTEYDVKSLDNKTHRFSEYIVCLLYTSPSPRDRTRSRMPSSA